MFHWITLYIISMISVIFNDFISHSCTICATRFIIIRVQCLLSSPYYFRPPDWLSPLKQQRARLRIGRRTVAQRFHWLTARSGSKWLAGGKKRGAYLAAIVIMSITWEKHSRHRRRHIRTTLKSGLYQLKVNVNINFIFFIPSHTHITCLHSVLTKYRHNVFTKDKLCTL